MYITTQTNSHRSLSRKQHNEESHDPQARATGLSSKNIAQTSLILHGMNLSSSLLLSISFWNTVANPKFLFPMSASAFSTATSATTVKVRGSGVESVNTDYDWTPATIIPPGFEKVCRENRWGVESTWEMLNSGRPWLRASNEAYIYLNSSDGQWWIDKPNGAGVYVVPKDQGSDSCEAGPPATGWRALSPSYNPAPTIEVITESKN